MKNEQMLTDDNEIRLLPFPLNIRTRPGMYISNVTNADVLLREIVDNSTDESMSCPWCDTVIIEQDFNGYYFIADNGRGIPIKLSQDVEGEVTQTEVAFTSLHSGSKFSSGGQAVVGMNGVGGSSVNALSTNFIVLSKITEENWDKSVPVVREAWEKCGPRQRKDLYYIIAFERGNKVYEGADRIQNIEKMIFKDVPMFREFPRGMSTLTLFKPDLEIFESIAARIPKKNLEYFTLIMEKFYNRKVNVWINGEKLRDSIEPYQFEFTKTIIPSDPSKNPQLQVYVTYQVMDDLSTKDIEGSVNGLVVESGVHINYIQQAFEAALKSEYKITHKYLTDGLQLLVIMLVPDPVYDSQTKTRLKNISKVKASDFQDIAKEFVKQMRKNQDIFEAHVARLDALADSMKSFSAKEKSLRMISSGRGVGFFKSRTDLPKGFAEATSSNRLETELYLCFPAEQELLLWSLDGQEYTMTIGDLAERFTSGDKEGWWTKATTKSGKSRRTQIIACKEIKKTQEILRVVLTDGTTFRCTPDHKVMLSDGTYVEATQLNADSKLMFYEGSDRKGSDIALIQMENLTSSVPVYCLEVSDLEHNFPLANGVMVSNCEGLSAASSLVNGRHDTKTHAIFPLRGKVMNISDKDEAAALDNKEINGIFKLIGLGTTAGNVFEGCKSEEDVMTALQKYAQYGKIIISTDAKYYRSWRH